MFDSSLRLILLAAHPDDETIACGGLLQRVAAAKIIFATDGAPVGFGFEKKFRSLENYSRERFQESSRALGLVPACSFQRLTAPDGHYFPDRLLFEHMEDAFHSLLESIQKFSPDVLVSHAYEGGHVDHDVCSFLATQAAQTLSLKHFEFPLYWKCENGNDIFQRFREEYNNATVLELSPRELAVKKKMLAEYWTQRDIVALFSPNLETFRPVSHIDYLHPKWRTGFSGGWRRHRDTRRLLREFSEFQNAHSELLPEQMKKPRNSLRGFFGL